MIASYWCAVYGFFEKVTGCMSREENADWNWHWPCTVDGLCVPRKVSPWKSIMNRMNHWIWKLEVNITLNKNEQKLALNRMSEMRKIILR